VLDQSLVPGAHLTTPRLGYRHHGLYVGNGRVLHYRGMSRWLVRGPVEEISLEAFAGGHGVTVIATPRSCADAEAAIQRARSRLGEDRWRLWSNNCEHFVTWCLDGAPRSEQVEAWRRRALGWQLHRPAGLQLKTRAA
jgi:Lecithin retinol acyltransferase